MRVRGNRTAPRGEFSREVTKHLIALEANNKVLWEALRDGGETCTWQYLNLCIQGMRHPRPELIDHICLCLGVDGDRRHRLHKAAAIDLGFQLGPL